MGAFMDILGGLANVGSTIAGTVDSIKTNREMGVMFIKK